VSGLPLVTIASLNNVVESRLVYACINNGPLFSPVFVIGMNTVVFCFGFGLFSFHHLTGPTHFISSGSLRSTLYLSQLSFLALVADR